MKQTLSLTPSAAPLGLDPWFAGSPLVVSGTVPTTPTMSSWLMQLWKRPHDIQTDGTEPLAISVGGVASGVVTWTFTAAQMTLDDMSNEVGTNNYWLTIGGVDNTSIQQIIRAGTIEIDPCPFTIATTGVITSIVVSDDTATFTHNGTVYSLPVSAVPTPEGAIEGELVVIDDSLVITFNGVSYTTPVVPVP